MKLAKLRPRKLRNAIRRRLFELRIPHTRHEDAPGGVVPTSREPDRARR